MSRFDKLRAKLKELKKLKSEILLGPIEKWMTNELGVERLPNTGGSEIHYRHVLLAQIQSTDGFTVHIIHGKKREMIHRNNFHEYLAKRIKEIIDLMELEAKRES